MHHALIAISLLANIGDADSSSPRDLAAQIDRRLEDRFEAEQIVPAPAADDAEFLRRATLDLIGRIPTVEEVREFLQETRPDKRARLIGRLLEDPQHARHFANTWRALLLPEAESDREMAYFVTGLEAWLVEYRSERRGFDELVREILTVPIVGATETPQVVLRDLNRPNPIAFIASKDADPGKLAAATTRLFMGIRLECAQCHDHPFDTWTSEQFWNQAAFFAGIERRGRGAFAPLVEDASKRTITIMETDATAPARFLDDAHPAYAGSESSRAVLAEWITSPDNPYFARAVVNRVWGKLMGVGIVAPVDDFQAANPPSHPELLDDLADAFVASDFDLDFLYRAICLTDAYQRTSRQTHASQDDPRAFARMSIKPLSVDQLYASLMLAVGEDPSDDEPSRRRGRSSDRRAISNLFLTEPDTGPPTTSILQSLMLMNGDLVHVAADPAESSRIRATLEDHPDDVDRQLETLYLATVSRLPTSDQRRIFLEPIRQGAGADIATRRLGDVFWALLNSAEFRWNH
jgi:hypothetical protein